MTKLLRIAFLFLIIPTFSLFNHAQAFIFASPYISGNIGSTDYDQSTSSTTFLDHNNNNFGVEIGSHLGLDLKAVRIGVTAAINWTHHDGRRADQRGFFF